MKKKIMPIMIFIFIISVFLITSGCSERSHEDHMKDSEMSETKNTEDSSIRKSGFDMETADETRDGKVYQDQMDWNVISDQPGKCPLCKMTLKEVSLKVAKDNLVKNRLTVK